MYEPNNLTSIVNFFLFLAFVMKFHSGRLHIILIMQIAIASLLLSESTIKWPHMRYQSEIGNHCCRWKSATDGQILYVLR
ncbi:conserved hypothetical protein [Trichinella spiralis]|uniref:hypothetical protein n=1 Tax=Trichinella spiralis TaxID=6334 RepID=UPI0001EFD214|nr:conserved hypothetical protein [Trichinella spiralis]